MLPQSVHQRCHSDGGFLDRVSRGTHAQIVLTSHGLATAGLVDRAPEGIASDSTQRHVLLPSLLSVIFPEVTAGGVQLFCEEPYRTLHSNAQLAEQQGDIFSAQVLRTVSHIACGGREGHTGSYGSVVVAPLVTRSVRLLAENGRPFWAGVLVCCVVLPPLLGVKKTWLSLSLPAGLGGSVKLVSRQYELVGDPVKAKEARIVYEHLTGTLFQGTSISTPCMSSPPSSTGGYALHGQSALLCPIEVCAVCGRRFPVREADVKGHVVVQCLRCGHGGHQGHMMQWRSRYGSKCPLECGECEQCLY
jgi:hypothetical protein